MTPFFSVIIPLYNKEKYIKTALQSVLNQNFGDFEVIIINDGSTDKSFKIVSAFKDERIKLLNQENKGLSITRNRGISLAQGSQIAFLDADDYWKENHLLTLRNLIKDFPNEGMYCSGYTLQKSNNIFHRARFNGLSNNHRGIVDNFFKHSLQHCIAWVGSICIPKYVFDEIGTFDPDIYSEQDIDLYIRIALKYNVVLDNTVVTAIYNCTLEDNMSQFWEKKKIPKFLNSYKEVEATNSSLNRYMDLNRFSTIVFFKLADKNNLAKELIKDLSFKNLTLLQRAILKSPNYMVKFFFDIKTKYKLNPLLIFRTT